MGPSSPVPFVTDPQPTPHRGPDEGAPLVSIVEQSQGHLLAPPFLPRERQRGGRALKRPPAGEPPPWVSQGKGAFPTVLGEEGRPGPAAAHAVLCRCRRSPKAGATRGSWPGETAAGDDGCE